MADTRWNDIFKHLKAEGIEVYSPATKTGMCKSPYVVVKDSGDIKTLNASATQRTYDILCYVPKNRYSEVEVYADRVAEIMDGLWPMIRPLHDRTEPYLDDTFDAWMTSMMYVNYRKNKRP